ncbi:MAG TPA: hypothetical protein PKA00_17720, partial [Saprospiraceae bacterium]|nr:hypothetical protein [Saprospiraceae bacterium]
GGPGRRLHRRVWFKKKQCSLKPQSPQEDTKAFLSPFHTCALPFQQTFEPRSGDKTPTSVIALLGKLILPPLWGSSKVLWSFFDNQNAFQNENKRTLKAIFSASALNFFYLAKSLY